MRPTLKALLVLFLLSCSYTTSFSAHIVGGDFSYRHISGDTYEIKMKMYRDCGGGGAPFEQFLDIGLYNKENNQEIKNIRANRTTIYPIRYNSGCINPQLRCVEVGIFIGRFTMPKTEFNNVDGYYVQWERCCRNNIIKNIVDPGGTPMAFYMEIASPYPNNGNFRLNNSPEFRRDPLNYLCVGETFKYDFKVWDNDGDELRIKSLTPLAGGYTSQFNPQQNTGPAPYDDVVWGLGYGTNNIMDGNPDLYVDGDSAWIYIVPQQIGVYVISVLCEEFRNGEKIGEIRRELQLEVLNCPPRFKPNAVSSLSASNNKVDVIIGQQICVDINGTDANTNEILRMRVDTVGMYKIIGNGATLNPDDVAGTQSITSQFCWTPACPLDTSAGTFIDFIIYDDSCPFSQDDTIRVDFNIIESPNNQPQVITSLNNSTLNIRTGESGCFLIQGTDLNVGDQIYIESKVKSGVDIFALGAQITPQVLAGATSISGQFCWTPSCGLKIDSPIVLEFIISDDACPISSADTIEVTINVLPILNEQPSVTPEGTNVGFDNTVSAIIGQQNCFYVFAEDVDDDVIDLYSQKVNYDFDANGATYTLVDDYPNAKRYQFCWTPTCDNIYSEDDLFIDFLVRDNKCENEKYDTLRIRFAFSFPPNDSPALLEPDSSLYNLNAGYGRSINVFGTDPDVNDRLILSATPLYGPEVPLRIDMQTVNSFSNVRSTLNIYADCGLNSNTLYPVQLTLLSNKICNLHDTVTKVVYFQVAPLEDISEPMIPNAFSPNGDGINDEFKINLANRTICPDDFILKIYDRWGQIVFETEEPDFVWKAEQYEPGAYIYYMQIGKTKYSGFVALVK